MSTTAKARPQRQPEAPPAASEAERLARELKAAEADAAQAQRLAREKVRDLQRRLAAAVRRAEAEETKRRSLILAQRPEVVALLADLRRAEREADDRFGRTIDPRENHLRFEELTRARQQHVRVNRMTAAELTSLDVQAERQRLGIGPAPKPKPPVVLPNSPALDSRSASGRALIGHGVPQT